MWKKLFPNFKSPFSNMNIRNKLFLVILVILILNMGITTFFGQTFFGELYTLGKSNELKSIQREIKASYLSNSKQIAELIGEAENKNITILIFTLSDTSAEIEYFSRSIPSSQANSSDGMQGMMGIPDRGRYSPMMWINFALSQDIISSLDSQKSEEIIESKLYNFNMRAGDGNGNQSLQIYSKINDKVYLFLETPQEYIAQTANMAVRFMLYVSIFTLFIALLILAFISKRITRPISNIQNVANKIANLNFSEKCLVETTDELGQLGTSINRMADTLQENINKLTKMNEVLRADLEREAQTNKIRREFIANVSHDFKTPLSLITAYGEAIRDNKSEDTNEYCNIILSESKKMDELVNQLLKLSQLENNMVVLEKSIFDLTGFVTEIISQYKILLKSKNINVDFSDMQERIAYGDFNKMTIVMRNLYENAIKYSNNDGTIKIWITKDDKFKINIYNDVENLDAINTEYLFDSFYKTDNSRSLEDKSYGLGLAIVKAIVELHGNKCGAYKQDDGLAFWFEIEIENELTNV